MIKPAKIFLLFLGSLLSLVFLWAFVSAASPEETEEACTPTSCGGEVEEGSPTVPIEDAEELCTAESCGLQEEENGEILLGEEIEEECTEETCGAEEEMTEEEARAAAEACPEGYVQENEHCIPTGTTTVTVTPTEEETPTPIPTCTRDTWECGQWGECTVQGTQKRNCSLVADCEAVHSLPPLTEQSCEPTSALIKQTERDIQEKVSEKITKVMQETPAFKSIVADKTPELLPVGLNKDLDTDRDGIPDILDSDPLDNDQNRNGIPDNVDKLAGQDPLKVDAEDIKLQREAVAEVGKLVKTGVPREEAQKRAVKTLITKRAKRKVEKIRTVAKSTFGQDIKKHTDDSDSDGISDEVAVGLGLAPSIIRKEPTQVSLAEQKIYSADPTLFDKKCTTNIYSGMKLSVGGFAVLAACPKNKPFTLYVYDKSGKEIPLATRRSSENSKIVFVIPKDVLTPGSYVFQVRSASIGARPNPFLSTAFAESPKEDSDPVVIEILQSSEITRPIVKTIQGQPIEGLRDIKISAGEDKRIHVTGVSDISTTVVGTFSSAVFTSALLADVENGFFEIVSPASLEEGDHEVVIYAARSEDGIQSEPAVFPFRIIDTAKASAPLVTTPGREAARETEKPFFSQQFVVYGGLAILILIVAVAVVIKKRKNRGRSVT